MTKVLPWGKERREEGRKRPDHAMPLNVVRDSDKKSIACRLHDLSADGLCVLVKEAIAPGTRVRFRTLKREFLLEVAWCDPVGPKDLRCGLTLTDKEDMRQLFAGFLGNRSAV